jgi:threonine synthase
MKAKKGMGFKAAQKQIAKKQGISQERAGAILAAGARKASKKAIKKNPNLLKVTGVKKAGRGR